jgi:hypothetical protein
VVVLIIVASFERTEDDKQDDLDCVFSCLYPLYSTTIPEHVGIVMKLDHVLRWFVIFGSPVLII